MCFKRPFKWNREIACINGLQYGRFEGRNEFSINRSASRGKIENLD